MSAPVHFDVEKMRADHQAANAKAVAEARAKAKTPQDLIGIDIQERFLGVMLEASTVVLQARNDGYQERHIAKALGHVLGNIGGNFVANAMRGGRFDSVVLMVDAMQLMMDAGIKGMDNVDGMVAASVTHAATRGGHA